MNANVLEGWTRVPEAAHMLGISRSAVHGLCDRGTLAFRWVGGLKWIRIEDVRKLASDPGYRKRKRACNDRELQMLAGQRHFLDATFGRDET